MLQRRKFIKLVLAGTVVAGTGYTAVAAFRPFRKSIAAIIMDELNGLRINEEEVHKFAALAAVQNPWHFGDKAQKIMNLYSTLPVHHLPLPFKTEYKDYCDQIVTRFLLSTDFFINKMDEQKEIRFSGKIWGNYTMPCMNPFSALFYPNV